MSKKQNCTAMSSAEAEYVALSASCAQVIGCGQQHQDYGFNLRQNYRLLRLSFSHKNIMQNPVHTPAVPSIIQTRYQFIKEQVSVSCQAHWYEMFDSSRTGEHSEDTLLVFNNDDWKLLQCHHQTTLRIHKDGDGDALFQLKSDSLPHAHAQTTKTYYKHRDSRIMKA
ncbi:hypothetical protein Tco_0640182 [Tanacetum coccineum]